MSFGPAKSVFTCYLPLFSRVECVCWATASCRNLVGFGCLEQKQLVLALGEWQPRTSSHQQAGIMPCSQGLAAPSCERSRFPAPTCTFCNDLLWRSGLLPRRVQDVARSRPRLVPFEDEGVSSSPLATSSPATDGSSHFKLGRYRSITSWQYLYFKYIF